MTERRRLLGAVVVVLLAAGLLVQPASGDGTLRQRSGAPAARPSVAATSAAPRPAAGGATSTSAGGSDGRAEAPVGGASQDAGHGAAGRPAKNTASRGASDADHGAAGSHGARSTGTAARRSAQQRKDTSKGIARRAAVDRSAVAPTDRRGKGRTTVTPDTPAADTPAADAPAAEPATGAPAAVEPVPAPSERAPSGARKMDGPAAADEPATAAPEQSVAGGTSDGARTAEVPSQGVRETPSGGGAGSPTPSPMTTPAGAAPTTAPDASGAPATETPSAPNDAPGPATGRRPAASDGGDSSARSASTTPAALPSRLDLPLVTPATEALSRVRPAGAAATSQPYPGDGTIAPLSSGEPGGDTTSTTEVLVWWASAGLAALGLLVLVLGANAARARARTRRLERQRVKLMEDIGLLQAALLPAVPSRLGALLTTVAYRPADGPAAGGDFYDAFPLEDGRVGLLLGDISGHGRQALAQTTLVRFTVRAHLEAGLSPREALTISGRSLEGRLSDDFATVIAAIHDPRAGTLTYASAGHPPPIVVGADGQPPVTASSAPPIGVGFPTGQRQTVLPMPPGTAVMIHSDGLLEARIDGVAIGPERLAAWLRELGPEATATALLNRVVASTDRVPDDLAAVLVQAAPGAEVPATRIEQLKLDVLDLDGPDLDGFLVAAGVGPAERRRAGRRASELLATTSGVVVEVRMGERPTVHVAPIGDDAGAPARPHARTR